MLAVIRRIRIRCSRCGSFLALPRDNALGGFYVFRIRRGSSIAIRKVAANHWAPVMLRLWQVILSLLAVELLGDHALATLICNKRAFILSEGTRRFPVPLRLRVAETHRESPEYNSRRRRQG